MSRETRGTCRKRDGGPLRWKLRREELRIPYLPGMERGGGEGFKLVFRHRGNQVDERKGRGEEGGGERGPGKGDPFLRLLVFTGTSLAN